MLEELKAAVCEANRELPRRGLVTYTWGNVSGLDRARGLMVIKPSGVPYDELRPDRLVTLDLDGRVVEGTLRPSSDAPTHLALYRAFAGVGGVAHTHSRQAAAWAQAGRDIPALGTTHADYFHGPIPCARALTDEEIAGDYEAATGRVLVEALRGRDPLAMPAALARQHASFTWGRDAAEAVHNAVVLEEVAGMALHTLWLSPDAPPVSAALLDRHYRRKHGPAAYYGQPAR